MDRCDVCSDVDRCLHWSVIVKQEISRMAKLLNYRSIFVPTLTYGHDLWVVTERMRTHVEAAEMSVLRRVTGIFLRDRVRSSSFRDACGVEPLLFHTERSQLRYFVHLVKMASRCLPDEVLRARPTGRRPRGRPRTH